MNKNYIQVGMNKLKIGMTIKTKYNKIATIVGFANESLSHNTLILVDKLCVGKYDEEYGYDRKCSDNEFWIYPGEILEVLDESRA